MQIAESSTGAVAGTAFDMAVDTVISVRVLTPAWRADVGQIAALARRAAQAALKAALPMPRRNAASAATGVTIVFGDDALLRRLNRDFRGIDKPTNVLSFAGRTAGTRGAEGELGDVILARETVAAEAAAQGKTMADHTSHLIVHGVLHLLGHDHERTTEAARMEAIEVAVLAGLGIGDPYAGAAPKRQRNRRAGPAR